LLADTLIVLVLNGGFPAAEPSKASCREQLR
jgi:hypothetical protein